MARNQRGRMALYEVMSKVRFKSGSDKMIEKLHPEKTESEEERPSLPEEVKPEKTVQWRHKPRAVQFITDRIEFSLSYPVAAAVVLGIILLILLVFRAGQYYSFASLRQKIDNPTRPAEGGRSPTRLDGVPSRSPTGEVSGKPNKAVGELKPEGKQITNMSRDVLPVTAGVESAKPKGNNIIVLVEYPKRADLVPVQKHFAEYGIATEIMDWDGRYFLITKDKYEGFGPGSDGYQAKQKILEIGALYKDKAPEGYESFAPNFFKDAYGKKVE